MDTLTQERLKELLDYDPDTGIFVWKTRPSQNVKAGDIAGCKHSFGYVIICIRGTLYLAHRLAWLYVYGKWPENKIDHIDHDPGNTRIANLRDVTHSINMQNTYQASKNNLNHLLGVSPNRKGFKARIYHDGKSKCLGTYQTALEAHLAYIDAKRAIHLGCTI